MASIGHHLARRAIQSTQDHFASPAGSWEIVPENELRGPNDAHIKEMAVWATIIVWVTAILYMTVMSAVSPALS